MVSGHFFHALQARVRDNSIHVQQDLDPAFHIGHPQDAGVAQTIGILPFVLEILEIIRVFEGNRFFDIRFCDPTDFEIALKIRIV